MCRWCYFEITFCRVAGYTDRCLLGMKTWRNGIGHIFRDIICRKKIGVVAGFSLLRIYFILFPTIIMFSFLSNNGQLLQKGKKYVLFFRQELDCPMCVSNYFRTSSRFWRFWWFWWLRHLCRLISAKATPESRQNKFQKEL